MGMQVLCVFFAHAARRPERSAVGSASQGPGPPNAKIRGFRRRPRPAEARRGLQARPAFDSRAQARRDTGSGRARLRGLRAPATASGGGTGRATGGTGEPEKQLVGGTIRP